MKSILYNGRDFLRFEYLTTKDNWKRNFSGHFSQFISWIRDQEKNVWKEWINNFVILNCQIGKNPLNQEKSISKEWINDFVILS